MSDTIENESEESEIEEDIDDDTIIYYYNNKPIFTEFLGKNNFFDSKIINKLKEVKWGNMSENDKKYYLFQKIQYYKCITNSKSLQTKEIAKKNNEILKRINELQEKIKKKENIIEEKKKKIEKIQIFEKNISEYNKKIEDLAQKIKIAETKLENFEKSQNSPSISSIVSELQLEKNKLSNSILSNEKELIECEKEIDKITETINKY